MTTTQIADLQERTRKNWWILLLWGCALILFSMFLFFWPAKTAITLVMIAAFFLLVSGIITTIGSIIGRDAGWGWQLATGIIGILVGIFLLANSLLGAVIVIGVQYYLLGIAAVVMGIITMVGGKRTADTVGYRWSWGNFFLGLLILILGIFFLMNPLFGILTLLWALAGVSLVGGIITVVLSFQIKGQASKAA